MEKTASRIPMHALFGKFILRRYFLFLDCAPGTQSRANQFGTPEGAPERPLSATESQAIRLSIGSETALVCHAPQRKRQGVEYHLLTRDAEAAARQLQTSRVTFVSSGVVANHIGKLGFNKAFLVRDPDGHAVEIEEK
jgi:hypothetical protein